LREAEPRAEIKETSAGKASLTALEGGKPRVPFLTMSQVE
jgi:hypothetical protein